MSSKIRSAALSILIIGAGIFSLAALSGLLFEQSQRARDRERFPQIGRSFDVGGRSMNLYCSGSGQPAVILGSGANWPFYDPKRMFEEGLPRPGLSWVRVQRELANTTTTCWFDRAGSGWSDLGPYPRDSAAQARDLHALLEAARVPPPYLLVSEASAALDARVYTALYPSDVAGLVFADGLDPDFFSNTHRRGPGLRLAEFTGHSQDMMAHFFDQVGLYRLAPAPPPGASAPDGISASEWDTIWYLGHSGKARSSLMQDIAAWAQSARESHAANLGDRPFVALSSEAAKVDPKYRDVWLDFQSGMARLSTRGKQVQVHEAGADLVYQAPGAIVEAVRQVLTAVR